MSITMRMMRGGAVMTMDPSMPIATNIPPIGPHGPMFVDEFAIQNRVHPAKE
jgi:hypothetical protein